ncbi:ABC transporter ATP-binding protein [Calditerrivibrio nitroreducens]|uniref:ABC transporter related protein n=1 Tax=Calditerrivibrio nitroreducens (strain DSM 19672 / NBRC 101217 / Yu37-1) TaxID=768670 RepID=E4TIU1_CALNY|nr:ABC transporter ATP-binding protein [Calditerrivibrio nitroreducens]ADR18046.1 ABC transporter related protein [Calditerrivibrio nitroreducens DSM 19672]
MSFLEILNISKSYRKSNNIIQVLNSFTLTIEKGESVVVVGPSGSGKSTLMHIIGGLDKPDTGNIIFKGENIFNQSYPIDEYRNKKVGFVFQFHYLLNDFTALENVAMPAMIAGTPINKAIKHAEFLLDKVGLSHRYHHHPNELSGGEQQRVAVARALMNEPELLLADEPTGNLDGANTLEIMKIFDKLKSEGVTIIMVTHDEKLTQNFDRKVVLEKL